MKIVVLTNLFPNKNDPMNGIFNRERVTALQRLGCEVIVIAPISYAPKLRYLFPYPKIKSIIKHIVEVYSLPKRDTYKDIDVLRVKRFALPNKLFWQYDYKVLKFFNGRRINKIIGEFKPDFILTTGLNPESTYAVELKKKFSQPIYSIFEGSDILVVADKYSGFNKIYHILQRFVDKVIYVSDNFKQSVEEKYHFQSNVVIKNGYNADVFKYSRVSGNNKNEVTNLLNVGRLLPLKGQDILLKSLLQLSFKYELKVIGDGYMHEEYATFVQKNALNVNMLPQLPQSSIKQHMDTADLFIMPSRTESFGIAALEAMACGLPVIAANVGGLKDHIIEGFNGVFFESESVDGLAKAIEKATTISWNHEEIAHWVKRNYSWETWAQKVMALNSN